MDPLVSVQNKNFTGRSLQKFLDPDRKPKVIYTDNSVEFGKACEDLAWNHCTSTPQRSETNGIAEEAVRRVKEGTSAVLLQSGLNKSWWADSMECYTYLRNVTDLLSDGKTPYERRFGQPCKRTDYTIWFIGWVSPYNCERSVPNPSIWKESFTWIVSRIRIVRGRKLEGWRTGCRPWGVGDHGRIGNLLKKTQCERGDISQTRRIYFSNRRWTNQNPWRRSRPDNIHLGTGSHKSRRKSPWFSWRIRRSLPPPHDSFPDAGEAINDFWSMSGSFIYRHHVEPRVKLYSPREESFLFH